MILLSHSMAVSLLEIFRMNPHTHRMDISRITAAGKVSFVLSIRNNCIAVVKHLPVDVPRTPIFSRVKQRDTHKLIGLEPLCKMAVMSQRPIPIHTRYHIGIGTQQIGNHAERTGPL